MAEYDNSMNDAVTMRVGPGSTLGRIDQYDLLKELGGGGFGTVYLARDTVSGIDVAVKGLPPFVKNSREEVENIRSNFALVSRLHHPNIAAALVLHPAKDVVYTSEDVRQKLRVDSGDMLMVMEYAPGVTLSQWRKQFPDRKVPVGQALEITRQIASALDYAHERKIVHRDIKPANVMIETSEDGSVAARVLDFGLAAEIRSSMGRVSREIHDTSGTRPYMAPEQWLGGKQGPATDQYALAALFCELVTGDVPFAAVFDTGDPVVMMNVVGREPFAPPQDLPKPIRLALSKALAKQPDERFSSCGDFVAALDGNAKSFSFKDRRGNKGEASVKGGMGRIVAVVALVAAVACGGYFGWMKYDEGIKAREAEQARIVAEKAAEAKRIKHEVYELKGKASQARLKLKVSTTDNAVAPATPTCPVPSRQTAPSHNAEPPVVDTKPTVGAPAKPSLSPAAKKLVGRWSCYCNVTYHDSLGSRADDTIKRYLPVSSTISLNCNEDGTVVLSDSSGRTFGMSRGRWKYRHGMLLMDLKSDDGRTFTLGGTVNWRGDSFELHYDNSEFANMIRKSCEKQITDINAVLSSYVDDQLEVSISTKTPSFKIGHARCSPHVFSRQ